MSNCVFPPLGTYKEQSSCTKEDSINHPSHYNLSPAHCECGRRIECIDVTRHMGFSIGNAFKYIWRHQYKDPIQSLKKAVWYINDYIKFLENKVGEDSKSTREKD